MSEAGNPAKRDRYIPRLNADGEPVLELRAPLPNDSMVVIHYPVTKAKALRIDHLEMNSNFDPRVLFRDQQLHISTAEVIFSDISKAIHPNIINTADAPCSLIWLMGSVEIIH